MKEKFRERLRLSVIIWISITVILILTIAVVDLGWIARKDYSVLGAPFLEEAFKGYFAFIFATLLYLKQKCKIGLRGMGLLAGLFVGFMFGYAEGVFQKESIQYILSGIVIHSLWTTAVSVGFCSFLLTNKKSLPIAVYLIAVGAHGFSNYDVYYTSALASPISIILTLLAILIALSTFPKPSRAWGKTKIKKNNISI